MTNDRRARLIKAVAWWAFWFWFLIGLFVGKAAGWGSFWQVAFAVPVGGLIAYPTWLLLTALAPWEREG